MDKIKKAVRIKENSDAYTKNKLLVKKRKIDSSL